MPVFMMPMDLRPPTSKVHTVVGPGNSSEPQLQRSQEAHRRRVLKLRLLGQIREEWIGNKSQWQVARSEVSDYTFKGHEPRTAGDQMLQTRHASAMKLIQDTVHAVCMKQQLW